MLRNIKMKKKKKKQSVAKLGHNDILPVFKSYFAKMPTPHETLNRI